MTETHHTHMVGHRVGHCLLRKPVRVTPNADFRRWAMNLSSQIVLLDNLEWRDGEVARGIARAARAVQANAEVMANLGKGAAKLADATQRLGKALNAI
jgi:hypothetical protein